MLEVNGVDAYFGKSHVLFGVSLAVKEGQVVSILGRNGAGKSTILKCIMGMVPHRTGRIEARGRDLLHMPTYEITRLGIAYVPEDRRVFGSLSVLENMQVSLAGGSEWTIDRVQRLFPVLRRKARISGSSLSGGEQQMLAIARALLTAPRILLLDEPFQGLAPIVIKQILVAISEIRDSGVGLLLVEQNLPVVSEVADRLYVIEKGAVVYEGSRADFSRQHERVRRYLAV